MTGAADATPNVTARLEIVLSTPPALAGTTRSSLIDEVTAIWRRERVHVEWSSKMVDHALTGRRLRVLVIPGPETTRPLDTRPETVGELLRSGDGQTIAIASLQTAERIVRSSKPDTGPVPDALYHHRLGLVLGRTVAHEIGHYLLDSRTHAHRGLMRARFGATEFADVRSGLFFLDRETAARLESRIALARVN